MTPRTGRRSPGAPGRLGPVDLVRLATHGVRVRPARAVLAALGIAVGVAAMIAVIGISESSRAEVEQRLAALGTNLLRVSPAKTPSGATALLPRTAPVMVANIAPVRSAGAVGQLDQGIYRNAFVPSGQTAGLSVYAAQPSVLTTLRATLARGRGLTGAVSRYPSVVLGADAARSLGVTGLNLRLWSGRQWVVVVGILRPVPLAPELDSAALVDWGTARAYFRFDGHPSTIYVRADESQVLAVDDVLSPTADPEHPEQVFVVRPSDALVAREAATSTLNGLLLGLGMVALVVGGVGIANTMVISVIERRAEIGLRRALGSRRAVIRRQFVTESLLLATAGGVVGVAVGVLATAGYASSKNWPTVVPAWASIAGIGVTMLTGALAGLVPAIRASRLSPTEALR